MNSPNERLRAVCETAWPARTEETQPAESTIRLVPGSQRESE